MAVKRRFGRVRKLPSGRWQSRYVGPDGIDRPAPRTFDTKRDAEVWLSVQESELVRGAWIDPSGGQVGFGPYAEAWVRERPNLRPKTIQLYTYLLARHLVPSFGNRAIADIREAQVRSWRHDQLESGVSAVTLAKAYRLMRAVLNTAVDDGLIRRNPCRIKGAGQEHSAERPTLAVPAVFELAEAVAPRYRTLILLATFGSLRWSELVALRRRDVDLAAGTVFVERSKTEAGRRTVVLPAVILGDVEEHLATYSHPGPGGLVFTAPAGGALNHSNFRRRQWLPAIAALGLPELHFHDLRHTGNTLTAEAGANLRELMERMGHTSTRAALIYLHSTSDRQRRIAADLSDLVRLHREGPTAAPDTSGESGSGTQRARGSGGRAGA